jgi:hypothetical protein
VSRPSNRRLVSTLIAATALTAVLAGCGGSGKKSDGSDHSGSERSAKSGSDSGGADLSKSRNKVRPNKRAVITPADAQRVLDRYSKTNSAANKTLNSKLLGTVEGDTLLRKSQSDYKQFPAYTAKERATYQEPFSYVRPTFHIPLGTDWFAATVHSDAPDSKGERLLVFDRGGAERRGGDWKLVMAVTYNEKDQDKAPQIEHDRDGYAKSVPIDSKRGALAPADFKDALNDIYLTGGTGYAAGKLGDSEVKKSNLKSYRERNDKLTGGRTNFAEGNPRYDDPYALRTVGGGSLVYFNAQIQRVENGTTNYIVPNAYTAIYTGKAEKTHFRMVSDIQGVGTIPPKGQALLLGLDWTLTDASGS